MRRGASLSREPHNPIDQLMERASQALASGAYLSCATLSREALTLARRQHDFERMRRICMPMLEANRFLRQNALDTGVVRIITRSGDIPPMPDASCYLFAPGFIGADALSFRHAARDAGIGAFVLTREPTTARGQWPIVGVAERVVRVRIDPPINDTPTVNWFSAAAEALGDQALADARAAAPADPAPWIVDDFLERLDACPEHEKFIMALAHACADANDAPKPAGKRRRGLIDDPYSF